MRFWDSSAIVPLVVTPPGRNEPQTWIEQDDGMVVWTLSEIEVLSALRRLHRERAIDEGAAREAEILAASWMRRAYVVGDADAVKTQARRLLRIHALRVADALQLAAALAWADGPPDGLILHTFDRRLASAAHREGFRVVPDPR